MTFDQELRLLVLGFAITAMIPVVPVLGYVLTQRRRRGQWVRAVTVGDDYRQTQVATVEAADAPRVVKATAVLSWWLGQMLLPGIQAVILGRFGLVGVVGLPGLALAFGLLLVARPLLRGDPAAVARAQWLAKLARWLNGVVVFVASFGVLWGLRDLARHGLVGRDLSLLGATVATLVYAVISLVHARMLGKSAAAIEANEALRNRAVPQVPVAPVALQQATDALQSGDVAGSVTERPSRAPYADEKRGA
ncbi:MAG: hypothetical protein Q8Q09_01860 [Deltaproteobacteria bacterium]|nr:hypothetical protein [Deltaproteobacteria bacterium]